jgi:nitrite reductase (NADH) small subunit
VEIAAWQDVAALADIPEEGGLAVQVGERTVALFRDGEKIVAIEDSCPHRGGHLSEGIVRAGSVFCPLHAWCFRLSDGCNEDEGPDADVFPVLVEGDRVKVRPVPPSA